MAQAFKILDVDRNVLFKVGGKKSKVPKDWLTPLLAKEITSFKECVELAVRVEISLKKANFRGVDLRGANLDGADLEGADFHGANLEKAILKNSNIETAIIDNADFTNATFSSAEIARNCFQKSNEIKNTALVKKAQAKIKTAMMGKKAKINLSLFCKYR